MVFFEVQLWLKPLDSSCRALPVDFSCNVSQNYIKSDFAANRQALRRSVPRPFICGGLPQGDCSLCQRAAWCAGGGGTVKQTRRRTDRTRLYERAGKCVAIIRGGGMRRRYRQLCNAPPSVQSIMVTDAGSASLRYRSVSPTGSIDSLQSCECECVPWLIAQYFWYYLPSWLALHFGWSVQCSRHLQARVSNNRDIWFQNRGH